MIRAFNSAMITCGIVFTLTLLPGCSTTQVVSHRDRNLTTSYSSVLVAVPNPEFAQRKLTEERVVELLKERGIQAEASYKSIPPTGISAEDLKSNIEKLNIDSVLILAPTENTSTTQITRGTDTTYATDLYGRQYVYEKDTTQTWTTASRKFEMKLYDRKTEKVVWYASSTTRTLIPGKYAAFSDFYSTAINNMAKNLVEQLIEDKILLTPARMSESKSKINQ